ncbi:MAG: Ppx/GppA family phosphatase [Merismopedia sp. SIO2A8]|nr:Ppx/GppA family phosphatase [Symploca sp. SIO2B6]NET47511.1 Ppx/GppA family phosphatase [Merismopedia sp. SIO2A8]
MAPSSESTSPPTASVSTLVGAGERILAAIDVGTNSFHLVVVKIQPHLPAFKIIAQQKDMVRLGDRDKATKNLTPEAMQRGMDALKRYQDLANSFNAEDIIAVATSAVREAPNGSEFLQAVEDELGISIDLIAGEEEARRIYLGVLSSVEFNGQPHIMIDIGGGSTELILGDGHDPRSLSSTKVGAVRLTSEFVTTDPISKGEYNQLKAYVRGMLERSVDELKAHLKPGESPQLIGTSGTIEAIASIHAHDVLDSLPQTLNGYEVTLEQLDEILTKCKGLTLKQRLELPGLSERRAEIIVAGAIVLSEAMKLLGASSFVVCERSLREGVIVDWMLSHGLIEDRLRYQQSVRKRSVLHLAHKFHVDNDHEERVARLALSIFDQTKGVLHEWDDSHREILWAAGMLHNCGHFVRHSSHHKHSYYLIRHGGLLGYTEVEIELVANIARYHRKSPPKKKHDPYRNLPSDRHRQLVDELSAMLRIGVALDRRQIGAIKAVQCQYHVGKRQLDLCLHAAFPGDECDLERWSLNEKKVCFEAAFSVKIKPKLETTSLISH